MRVVQDQLEQRIVDALRECVLSLDFTDDIEESRHDQAEAISQTPEQEIE